MEAVLFSRLTSFDWMTVVFLVTLLLIAIILIFLSTYLYRYLEDMRIREARKADGIQKILYELKCNTEQDKRHHF